MIHNSDELVDIIDDKNRVVGQALKVDAHKSGDLHRIVIAELVNSKGEYCFVKQASDRRDAGQYVSPVGGHVSAGERLEDSLVRECKEEIGITPVDIHFVGTTIYHRQVLGRDENHLFFVYLVHSDEKPVLNHESVEYKWFSVSEIQEMLKNSPNTFGAAWHHVFSNIFPKIYST